MAKLKLDVDQPKEEQDGCAEEDTSCEQSCMSIENTFIDSFDPDF